MKKTTWLSLIVAALVVALDQVSKYLISTWLPLGGAWSPFPGKNPIFRLVYTYNTGVAFGLFKDLGPIFMVIALLVAGVIIFYSHKLQNDQRLACVSLGLMLGGAVGNVIDRLRLGHVVDFIDVGIGTARWYTSNLADVSIVLGVILLGVATLLDERKHQQKKTRQHVPDDAAEPPRVTE